MNKILFLIILVFSFLTVKVGAQCVAVSSNVTICQSTTLTTLGGSMLNGTTTIQWTDNVGGSFVPDATTLSASWTPPAAFTGTATLTLTATAGCTVSPASASFLVTVTPTVGTPSIPTPSNSTICQGSSNTLYTTSATNATSYNWSVTGTGNTISGTGNTGTVSWAPGFTGTATIGVTATGCGTSVEASTTVNVTPTVGTPSIPTPSNSTICQGSSNTLYTTSATNATSYNWTVTGTGNTISGTGTTGTVTWASGFTGTATIGVTATGCGTSAAASTTVNVTPTVGTPSIPSPSNTTICQGSPNTSYTTSATDASSYIWSVTGTGNTISGTGSTGTVTWAPGFTGTATIGVIATGCGTSIKETTNVTVDPSVGIPVTPTPSSSTICQGSTSTVYTTSATNATSFNWSVTGAGNSISGNGTTGTVTWNPSFSGVATVSVTASGCGTSTPASTTVTVDPSLTASISGGTTPICSNTSPGTFTATGTGGTGIFSYLWHKDGVSTGITTQTYSPGILTASSTFYCAITSGVCGTVNSSTISISVTQQPSAVIVYSGSPWCSTAGVQNVVLTGNSGGVYSAPAGLTIDASSGAITTATSSAGTYTVSYFIAPVGGCGSLTASTAVTISPIATSPVVGNITQPTCSVPTGSVDMSGLPASGTWILTRSPGGVTTSGSGTSFVLTSLPSGTYSFTVTNSAGCISPASSTVVINAQPVSPTSPVQSVDCSLGFGLAKVTVTSPTGSGLEYSLDGLAYQASVLFDPVGNGSHYLSVRNSSGCTTTGPLFTVTCGCINPPTVTLSNTTGSICSTAAVTVTGNSFGGSATQVTLSSNGNGTLSPLTETSSPFAFTYTPAASDGGKIVVITLTTNNPVGGLCMPGIASYSLTVNVIPAAPSVGTITNLTCTSSTGSVVLNGLPSGGTWTLIRNPGAIITNGTGTSTTVSGLVAGTYNFIVTSFEGCISAASADAVINAPPSAPSAPIIGTITQPTCATSTGSVVLSGLPDTGTWSLTRTPGGSFQGSGTSTTVSAIPNGFTYTFSVTNSTGCTSAQSANVVINAQPLIPTAPVIGTITPPSCVLATGSVNLSGLPSSGTWTLVRLPGSISTTGTGTTTTISGLSTGTYNFLVTTSDGCLSGTSSNVVIPAQPLTPSSPVVGAITQPTFAVPTGSVVLNGLPSSGTWVITRLPGSLTTTGSGTSRTMTNLPGGVFTFTVTNSSGCTSAESASVTISTPGAPTVIITNPPAVCSPATVDLTATTVTAGSTPGLIYTYWTNSNASVSYSTPSKATNGTYYIKGTTVAGYSTIQPVTATVELPPAISAGADQTLYYQYSTTLNGTLGANETGTWSIITGSGTFANSTDPQTTVSSLLVGDNLLLWTVKGVVCPAVFDTLKIVVENLIIPTLITPNMDGKNDYFVIRGLPTLGKTELIIFDRRGVEVYKNADYDNSWNGVDYNNKPLPDDTYFYVLKSETGKSVSGYIVIRH